MCQTCVSERVTVEQDISSYNILCYLSVSACGHTYSRLTKTTPFESTVVSGGIGEPLFQVRRKAAGASQAQYHLSNPQLAFSSSV